MNAQQPAGVTLLYLTKQLELAVRSQLESVVAAGQLTSLQYTALTVLQRHPGLTSAQLARNSFVRAQTMAQMVTMLEDRGLILRDRDAKNKRQYLLSLTENGGKLLEQLRGPVADIENRMVAGLSEEEVAELRRMLRHCRTALGGNSSH